MVESRGLPPIIGLATIITFIISLIILTVGLHVPPQFVLIIVLVLFYLLSIILPPIFSLIRSFHQSNWYLYLRLIGYYLVSASEPVINDIKFRGGKIVKKVSPVGRSGERKEKRIGHRREEANDLGNIGNIYAGKGEPDKALKYYEEALKIFKELGAKGRIERVESNIAELKIKK